MVYMSLSSTCISQTLPSGSDYLVARDIPAKTLFFQYDGTGTRMPKINWGLDCAWISEANMVQGRNYLDLFNKNVSVVRVSFQPTYALNNDGSLSKDLLVDLNERLQILSLLGTKPGIYLNSDPKGLDGAAYTIAEMYGTGTTKNVSKWIALMKATGKYVESMGYPVVSVAPFNEPDYGWGHGTKSNLNDICKAAKNDSWFNGKRLMTGSTLNCSEAWGWFDATKQYSDEGNTHQLAGTFDDFKSFFQKVNNAGKVVTEDELHNTMEAMVGANYGLQNGIWWGTAEHTRSQFCRASDGNGYRLAYAENGNAFMAASVYRNTQDGVTEAFVGASERQATKSSFGFVSKDKDVYFDGYGPTRTYFVDMPADPNGTYQSKLQRNAEGVIKIQSGEDVQPAPVAGTWRIMNVGNGKVLTGNPSYTEWSGNALTIASNDKNNDAQTWIVKDLPHDNGGDFSYEYVYQANQQWWEYHLDNKDWGLTENNPVLLYPGGGSGCEQWWFEYAGDGSYYIHNRYCNLVLDVTDGKNVIQKTLTKSASQKWKLCDVSASTDLTAPSTPTGLSTLALSAAVKLNWNANNEDDLAGYTIFRTVKGEDDWNTIARAVKGTSYLDNTTVQGVRYSYKIKAVDKSCNFSSASSIADGAATGAKGLIAHYDFENSLTDNTANMMNCAVSNAKYADGVEEGTQAIEFNGTSDYALLPYQVSNMNAITFCAWINWNGGGSWQRIFDFGNGEDEYLFLCPSNNNGKMLFEIKANGTTQNLPCTNALEVGQWKHVAVTIGNNEVKIYIDGRLEASSTSITLKPSDVAGVCNYLGRSQFVADPLFNGKLDDVRIYNYALSETDIESLFGETDVYDGWGNASRNNPYNVTSLLKNPNIINDNVSVCPDGWTLYGKHGSGNGNYTAGTGDTKLECWNGTAANLAFDYYQKVDLPAGYYVLSADMHYNGGEGEAGLYVYSGNETHQPVTTFGEVLTNYSLEFYSDGKSSVNIGVKTFKTCSGTWFAADNFHLNYVGQNAEDKPINDGIYFLCNNEGKYVARGSSWGTRACVNDWGLPLTVSTTADITTFMYYDTGHYLFLPNENGDVYADNSTNNGFIVTPQEGGTYTIESSSFRGKYLGMDGSGNLLLSTDIYKWNIHSPSKHKANMAALKNVQAKAAAQASGEASLAMVTSVTELENAVSAYSYEDIIPATNITATAESFQTGRNNGTPYTVLNKNVQISTPGLYKFTINAFGRIMNNPGTQGLVEKNADVSPYYAFFGNETVVLQSVYDLNNNTSNYSNNCVEYNGNYYPNGQASALAAFQNNKYANTIWVYIPEAGTYSYGIKIDGAANTDNARWCCWTEQSVSITKYENASSDYIANGVHYYRGSYPTLDVELTEETPVVDLSRATATAGVNVTATNPNGLIYNTSNVINGASTNIIKNDVCENLVLIDGHSFTVPKAFKANNAKLTLSSLAGDVCGTLITPFDVTSLPGNVYVLDQEINTIEGSIYATAVTSIEANKPVLVTAKGDYIASNVQINTLDNTETYSHGNLVGTYRTSTAPTSSYVLQNHTETQGVAFYIVGDIQPTVKPFHAYMSNASNSRIRTIMIKTDDSGESMEANDISEIYTSTNNTDIYTTSGIRLTNVQSGVNIIRMNDGKMKKVVIK